jgi:PAS domain S-box-containing protein
MLWILPNLIRGGSDRRTIMSATEPNTNVLLFPVIDRDEVEFCVPEGVNDAENLLPIFLHDDSLGRGQPDAVLVHEGVRRGDGELHAVRLPDSEIVVRMLIALEGERVRLQALNVAYRPIELLESQIEIVGVVVRYRLECAHCRQDSSPGTATHIQSPASLAKESRPVMTWQMDARGKVTHADHTTQTFLGLSEQELRAGAWRASIHPDDEVAYMSARERALTEQVVYRNSLRIRDCHNEYRLVSVVLAPIQGDGGIVTGWHAVAELAEELHRRSA